MKGEECTSLHLIQQERTPGAFWDKKKKEAKLYTQVLAGVKHLICLLSFKNKYNMISLLFAKAT
jgi:hypothetical protein